MIPEDNNWIRKKLEETFLMAVRACLNDEKAAKRAAGAKLQFPGMPKDALAKILITRAVRKTMIEGALNGGAVSAAEIALATPAAPAAVAGISALLIADIAYTTQVQMELMLEIGYVYECPFSKDDEDDIWMIFKAALGMKGTERVGAYSRFAFTETASKQFRAFLRRDGVRRATQETVRKVAGKEIAKYLSEKVLMQLIWIANALIGAGFNRWFTRGVGRWAKVKAKIRASTFRHIDQISTSDRRAAILSLPIIFLMGSCDGEVSDNIFSLYSQTSNRLNVTGDEIRTLEDLCNSEDLETGIVEQLSRIESTETKSDLFNIAVTAAAASRLKINEKQHTCLSRLAGGANHHYSRTQLEEKLDYLRR